MASHKILVYAIRIFFTWKLRNELPVQNDPPLPDIDPIRLTYCAYCSLCSFCSLFKSEPLPRSPPCEGVIYVCRVIVWSHTVSLFPRETERERERGGIVGIASKLQGSRSIDSSIIC